MADGTIVWGRTPITGGDSGSQTFLSMATFEIVRQEGDDADIKQQAAWEFVKEWFLPENQEAYAKTAGLCARQDVWPRLMGAPDQYAEAGTRMIDDKSGIWSNHPKSVDIQYNLLAPHGQKMLQGALVPTSSPPTPRSQRRAQGLIVTSGWTGRDRSDGSRAPPTATIGAPA